MLASSIAAFGQVAYDFENNNIVDTSGNVIGEFTLTGTDGLNLAQLEGSTDIVIFGNGFSDPRRGQEVSDTFTLNITSLDAGFTIASPVTVASTSSINGSINPNPTGGFNIGNGLGNNAGDVGLSFNVNGQFTTGNVAGTIFVFDEANSDIDTDGALSAGQVAAADTITSGNHGDETFLFTPDAPLGVGDDLAVTVTSFNSTISGEAVRFNVDIQAAPAAVPEPSTTSLFGLAALGFILRRRRG